eukprot:COSAG06_NODE_516_length_14818_cov_18.077926_17_plen_63_part_00
MRTDYKENERKSFVVAESPPPKRTFSRCSPLVGSTLAIRRRRHHHLPDLLFGLLANLVALQV